MFNQPHLQMICFIGTSSSHRSVSLFIKPIFSSTSWVKGIIALLKYIFQQIFTKECARSFRWVKFDRLCKLRYRKWDTGDEILKILIVTDVKVLYDWNYSLKVSFKTREVNSQGGWFFQGDTHIHRRCYLLWNISLLDSSLIFSGIQRQHMQL